MSLLLLSNCSRSYVKFESKPENQELPQYSKRFNLQNYTGFARLQKSENLYYKNFNQDSLQTEFQFMFLNNKNDSVIYISTIPTRNLYDKSGVYLINHRTPNAHFFNHFYFGKISDDEGKFDKIIEFKSSKEDTKMNWNIRRRSDSIQLLTIDTYRTKKTGKDITKTFFTSNFNIKSNFGKNKKVIYKEINDYTGIGMSIFPDTIKVNTMKLQSEVKKIKSQYLIVNYTRKNEIKNIEIIFDEPYDKNLKYNAIRFKKNRILYVRE